MMKSFPFWDRVLNRKKKAFGVCANLCATQCPETPFRSGRCAGPGEAPPDQCWDVPVVCWSPSDGGFVALIPPGMPESTKIIDALSEGRPVSLPQSQQPVVVSRGTEEINGADMDEEADHA